MIKIIRIEDCYVCHYYLPSTQMGRQMRASSDGLDYCTDSKRYFESGKTRDIIPDWCSLEDIINECDVDKLRKEIELDMVSSKKERK